MPSTPLVTVAIPAYKDKYLYDTIQCVVNQTYKNIEIIIVDDASPNDIESVVNKFNDERISYHRNAQNLGKENPAHNWNKCLSYANGEFFCLLCDDDIYSPTFVESMLNLADKFSDCSVFRARACFIDRNGNETDRYPAPPEWESMEDYMWHTFKGYRTQTISEFFYRTNRLRECGGYALLPLAWYADYLSIFSFASDGGIASTYMKLVSFRQSGDNISSQDDKNIITKIEATNDYVDAVTQLIRKIDTTDSERDYLVNLLYYRTGIHTKWSIRHAGVAELWKIWRRRKNLRIRPSLVLYALFHPLK